MTAQEARLMSSNKWSNIPEILEIIKEVCQEEEGAQYITYHKYMSLNDVSILIGLGYIVTTYSDFTIISWEL